MSNDPWRVHAMMQRLKAYPFVVTFKRYKERVRRGEAPQIHKVRSRFPGMDTWIAGRVKDDFHRAIGFRKRGDALRFAAMWPMADVSKLHDMEPCD